jgi:thymidylate synthase
MKQYLDILDYCLKNGTKSENRTGTPTIRIPWGATFEHDMAKGFPLITTKKMGLKNIATELEFFIKGYTDKKWLQDRKCHIWDEWANKTSWESLYSKTEESLLQSSDNLSDNFNMAVMKDVKNAIIKGTRDLGPIYGWQWRHFGGEYKWNAQNIEQNYNPKKPGVDQLANLIDAAKENSTDRRLIVSAWNPVDQQEMALPPCHYSYEVLIHNNKLNLIWTQRSCDMFLGVPYNIASYAMLLLLFAKELGCEPGILRGNLGDVHIYENHVDQVKKQIKRKPKKLPTVEIPDNNWNGLLNWSADGGFVLKDYVCHSALKGEVAR